MSKFMTLLVEDDAFQREVLADAIKDHGFEVIECTTGEAAELIIASSGTELQALVTDHNLAGATVSLRQILAELEHNHDRRADCDHDRADKWNSSSRPTKAARKRRIFFTCAKRRPATSIGHLRWPPAAAAAFEREASPDYDQAGGSLDQGEGTL
jgi:hypothetical protein